MSIRASRNVLDAAVSTDPSCLIIGSIFMSPDSLNAYIGTGTGVKQLAFANGATSSVLSAASPATTRVIDGEASLTATTVAAGSSSIVGVRGAVTLATGSTLTSGYLYGVQGKLIVQGTLNVSGGSYQAALFGQLDFSAATISAAPNTAILWLDAGSSAATLSGVDAVDITNSTGKVLAAIFHVIADANYLFNLDDAGFSQMNYFVQSAVGGTQTAKLKIQITPPGGSLTTFYIPLNTA